MNNNQISAIAKNYSKALIETVSQSGSFELIKNQLSEIKQVIDGSDDLKVVLDNTSISSEHKISIVDEIFKDKIDDKLLNLLKILIEKNRMNEFDAICSSFEDMANSFENKRNVEVISSIPLNDELKSKITSKLEEKLKCEVIPQWNVDESVIAGLIFKFGDVVIDSSVKSKLESLNRQLLR